VDVVIFDLGLSSIQLDDLDRGFSFRSKQNLDMAMGLNDISALEVINNLSEADLKSIIKILGEEAEASKIAKNIVKHRNKKKITTTNDLVQIIEKSKKKNFSKKINPCTKTFQALRIFVNKEITELINGVIGATKILKPGGKILVLSFHSIEDKIIKYLFTKFSKNKAKPSRYFPENKIDSSVLFEEYKNKVFRPSKKEIAYNSRSRSAKLRFATRSQNNFEYPSDLIKKFKRYLELEEINV
jgi:16S rRNA (cytosine1402-N4)-methyltransferase